MTKFSYKAKDSRGKERLGEMEGESKKVIKTKLREIKLQPITVEVLIPEGQHPALSETPIIGNFVYKDGYGNIQIALGSSAPTTQDLVVFTKQLATMINSGIPLIQGLSILLKQQTSRSFVKALAKVQNDVENGVTLSDAMGQFPEIFDSLYIAMIQAGEESGNLDLILSKLVVYIEKAATVKSQVKSAMAYPVGVLILAFVIVTGLLVFVVPTFAQQFSESGKELPGITQMIIDASNFLSNNWYFLLGSLIIFFIVFKIWLGSVNGRSTFDKWILKAPVVGPVLKKIAVGRFCSTMSSMLTSGVNLLDALKICASSAGNKTIEVFIESVRTALEEGDKFSTPLSKGDLFPDMVVSMVEVGEATGALDEMLEKISVFYEEEVDSAIQTMLSLIEPIMIVFIGGVVGFIVVAMYLPVFDMAGTM
ncbi:MAG: pilus assembly protein PilC [Zetaproteobacteria bacterium]|nr:pilus assembly protein PilC [Pseudobdellovibrionaceae bacterium]